MLLRDKERRQRLRHQARRLAETGRYRNWRDVEGALAYEGRTGAPQALASAFTRMTLDLRCAYAWRKRRRDAE